MSFSTRIPATVASLLATALLALVASAAAATPDTGGAAYGDYPGETGNSELHAKPHGLLGKRMRFAGSTRPGTRIAIQRLDDGRWVTEATARANADGDYVARWRTDTIGVFKIRAVPTRGGLVRASAAAEPIRVTIFRPARSTWYGPGFYGNRTACGHRMTRRLVGVAHKTLPCGRKVAFLYKGRTITVPVVDRGPYANGASWDLTYAAAQMLGFQHTDTLGAVSLYRR